MKHRASINIALLVGAFLLASCGNALHNGTEMGISTVTLTGLPAIYEGKVMVFSYDDGSQWVHDDTDPGGRWEDPYYHATVAGGNLTFTFAPPLEITTPVLKFLLIDYPGKNWDSIKIDKKHSGMSGGDVELDSTWGGIGSPEDILGVVIGDDVEWQFQ
jgi:hypothetical protein